MRDRSLLRFVVPIAAVVGLCGQAAPPQPSPPSQDDVVVSAERLSPAEARKRAFDYVRRAGVAVGERPAARWIDKVCPRVTGVQPEIAMRIEQRIRHTARLVGAPVANAPCTPNALVMVVADPRATMRAIAERRTDQMRALPVATRRAIAEGDAPVRWWYRTGVRSRDGDRMSNTIPAFVGADNGGAGQPIPVAGDSGIMNTMGNSLVSTMVTRGIEGATVIVDAGKAAGVGQDALGDYIALVTLAEFDPLAEPPRDSVLGLFADPGSTAGLSAWDDRFLRALYRLSLDRRGRQHRTALANALIQDEARP